MKTSIGFSSSTTCSLSSRIKIYICQCQQINGCTKNILACTNKTILHGGTMTFSNKWRHACTLGGERWVRNVPDWILFKHHSLTIKLHKIIYMSMSANQWVHQNNTCMYKENYTTWRDNDFFKERKTYIYLGGRGG